MMDPTSIRLRKTFDYPSEDQHSSDGDDALDEEGLFLGAPCPTTYA